MDRAVAMAQEEGLYFLVDYHNWLVNDAMHVHEQEWLRTWGWLFNRYKDYLNVSIEQMKEIILKMLLDNTPVYFSADVSPDQDSAKGIMARNLYDYESTYGINLGMTKAERLLYRNSTSNHSMLLIGVDLRDGKPVKWLVENSWGSDRGNSGLWTMYDDWFDDNVYSTIVPSRYLPQSIRSALDQPAQKLPVWDPMW